MKVEVEVEVVCSVQCGGGRQSARMLRLESRI